MGYTYAFVRSVQESKVIIITATAVEGEEGEEGHKERRREGLPLSASSHTRRERRRPSK